MAQSKDESSKHESKSSTLPLPELNPLLNPLLAAHMGRWAEIYFTSPPEKREQAVADLVRELEGNAGIQELSTDASEKMPESAGKPAESLWPPAELRPAPCPRCDYVNSEGLNFCVMCGTRLPAEAETTMGRATLGSMPGTTMEEQEKPVPLAVEEHKENAGESNRNYYGDATQQSLVESHPSSAHFETLFTDQAKPSRSSYRVYLGVMLAILVAMLTYMTWRSTSAFRGPGLPSGSESVEPAAPASDLTVPANPAATVPKKPADGLARAVTLPALPNTTLMTRSHSAGKKNAQFGHGAKTEIVAQSPRTSTQSSGSQELTMAQKYLNGGTSSTRDSQQAATWLWRAVGKHNLTATVLLSDLYLRGDGVTKNCDQARLLLDAAARKGATSATERLRNLQAFGCQ